MARTGIEISSVTDRAAYKREWRKRRSLSQTGEAPRKWERTGIGISATTDRRAYSREWRKRFGKEYRQRQKDRFAVAAVSKPKRPDRCFSCERKSGLKPIERMRLGEHGTLVPATVLWCGHC